ncbi:MAG: hypoxanthine phosphoribosyltransferase [Actinobacteria bacterium]|nr:hypoxanthine phosphoribosyltransferase [Cyanobacteriota bacterium]MCL5771618.1 hypoxanthine phosphoribosyltransferase [Actinomycetota bacterium]
MEQLNSKNELKNWKESIKVLLSEQVIQEKVKELAAIISKDYSDKNPILIAVLKGSFIFIADLCRKLTIPVIFDFMAVSSYGDSMVSSGVVRITKDLDYSIENRDVLIIEDIIDSGRTLNYLIKNIKSRNPKSVEICALLDKDVPGKFKNKIKYKGFDIPNKFVVGYGLDYAENYRNLPYIGYIENII